MKEKEKNLKSPAPIKVLKNLLYRAFPVIGVLLALAFNNIIPNSSQHPASVKPYYNRVLLSLIHI